MDWMCAGTDPLFDPTRIGMSTVCTHTFTHTWTQNEERKVFAPNMKLTVVNAPKRKLKQCKLIEINVQTGKTNNLSIQTKNKYNLQTKIKRERERKRVKERERDRFVQTRA